MDFFDTDGSKTENSLSCAIDHSNLSTIKQGLLEEPCSIFSAEAIAIKHAAEYAKNNKRKYVISSDSRLTIDALQNLKNTNAPI